MNVGAAFVMTALLTQSESAFEVDWAQDTTLTLGAWTFALLAGEVASDLPGGLRCKIDRDGVCDPSVLNALDRSAVGMESKSWELISDIGVYSALLMPFVATGIDSARSGSGERFEDFSRDSLIIAQAMGIDLALTALAKAAFRRARPTHYRSNTDLTSAKEQYSFPSGHASLTAASASAYATAFSLRHENRGARAAVIATASAWTAITAYARVRAGRHFYTDVLAGIALGSTVGFLTAKAHERDDRPAEAVAEGRAPILLQWGLSF